MHSSIITGASAAKVSSIETIVHAQTGEFVTVTGAPEHFKTPVETRAPYSFWIKDTGGVKIRVCIWPEIFSHIQNRDLLKSSGAITTVTAEVAEYKGRLELHVQDWEDVSLAEKAASAVTTATRNQVPGK